MRVARYPAELDRLPAAQARAILDGLIDEAANRRRKEALPIVKALLDNFSRLPAPSLDDFELVLNAATRIPTDGGDPPFAQLRFGNAIAALPAAQRAEAIALLVAQPASFGPTIFLRESIGRDLLQLASTPHLGTLPRKEKRDILGALRAASDKSMPGHKWQLNKLLGRPTGGKRPPPADEPSEDL